MLPEVLRKTVKNFGSSSAYVSAKGQIVTYQTLDQISEEIAAWMQTQGLGEGSVIALCLPSSTEYILSYLAAAKLGAITAGVNPRFTDSERQEVLKILKPDLVLSNHDFVWETQGNAQFELVEASDSTENLMRENRLKNLTIEELPQNPDRAVCICFTSGSTGSPKGAWFTNRQLKAISDMDTGGAWGGAGHRYASTEFAHVGVMTKLPWLLASAGTTHLLDRWKAESVLKLINDYRISSVSAIAPQVALMLQVNDLDRFDFSCVKAIVTGGALASPELVEAGRELFGAPWSIRYSSTESGGVGLGTALDADDEEALHTVGRPRSGVAAMIRDEEGQPVARGDVGEIWLRSEAVMSGYWNDPVATDKSIVNGWLRTGDLAFEDDTGCFHLAGRTSEMYIRGGYNVFPLEVETVLSSHEQVAEIAVVPRKDKIMGEIGVAVVVPTDLEHPPTLDSLRNYSRRRLASYKIPEAIRILQKLPRNTSDKIDRLELRGYEN
ncbi:MAG: AMP-dependent synthetase [Acidimicrobiaceae bacterium]|nr:AMP-dependent synthetase [Acidimicrobiaceae bacterium]|tara:strand:+ start:1115 stop:2602 length:1488 start_codon:yes stop_codon:yes gene_type:complete